MDRAAIYGNEESSSWNKERKRQRGKILCLEIEREEALQLALNVTSLLASASGPSPWCNVGLANYFRALNECLMSFELRRNIVNGNDDDDDDISDDKLRLRLIRSKLETQHFARVAVTRAIDVLQNASKDRNVSWHFQSSRNQRFAKV